MESFLNDESLRASFSAFSFLLVMMSTAGILYATRISGTRIAIFLSLAFQFCSAFFLFWLLEAEGFKLWALSLFVPVCSFFLFSFLETKR